MASKVVGGRGVRIDVQMFDGPQIATTWQAISFPVFVRDAEKSARQLRSVSSEEYSVRVERGETGGGRPYLLVLSC